MNPAERPVYRSSYRAFSRNGRQVAEIIQIRVKGEPSCAPERGPLYRCGRGYCERCDAWRRENEKP